MRSLRLSRGLNYSGYDIPFVKGLTLSGKDKKWYYFKMRYLAKHLESVLGSYDVTGATSSSISTDQGVIVFTDCGWGPGATGHIDLWDKTTCGNNCYWSPCKEVSLWRYNR